MRILHLGTAYRPYWGGATVRLESVLVPLAKRSNMEVHLLVAMPSQRYGASEPYEVLDGVHVHRVDDQKQMLLKAHSLHRDAPFNLVHAHNARYGLLAWAALRCPLILEFHSLRDLSGLKGMLTGFVCNRANHIFVLADSAGKQLIDRYQLQPTKVETLYNGVKTGAFDPARFDTLAIRRQLGIDTQFVIGYCGTFHGWQGVLNLVRAFPAVLARCPATTLLLVGDGPESQALRAEVEQLDIAEKVVFTGTVPPDQVPQYLAAMDVVAIVRPPTAETNSAVPLKVLEGMSMARNVVVTPVLGLTEVVQHGVTGWITASYDPGEIGSVIADVLQLPATQRRVVGSAAREYVFGTFSWEATVDKMVACYHFLLAHS